MELTEGIEPPRGVKTYSFTKAVLSPLRHVSDTNKWERKMESNHVSKLMRLTGEPAPLQPLMVPPTRFELV